MENPVYEKYKNSIDADFAEAYDLLVRSGVHDENESGVYHAHGLHLCNQGMEKFDVKLMIQAKNKLKQAVDIKAKSKLYIQSQAVSLKIYGDISLRLAVRFKCNVQDNAELALESYKAAILLNSDIDYESCINLLNGVYYSLKTLNRSGEFRSLLVDWREPEDTSVYMRAAIDFNFSMMNVENERRKKKDEPAEVSP